MALTKREYTDQETTITAENLNDIQDAVIALEDGLFSVDDDKSGEVITITDAANRGLRSLKIYGKTTQDGTPTPTAPVELLSAGDTGSVSVSVAGKNLWNHANDMADMSSLNSWGSPIWRNAAVLATLKPKTTYTMKCKVTCLLVPDHSSVFSDQFGFVLHSSHDTANHKYMAASIGGGVLVAGEQRTLQGTFTTPDNLGDTAMEYRILYYTQRFLQEDGTAVYATISVDDVQLEIGNTASDYVPYTGQKLIISTPNGLPGIPVTSGGNYTDANGQQWFCDEIDFTRGVYVQRVYRKKFTNADGIKRVESGFGYRFAYATRELVPSNATNGAYSLCDSLPLAGYGGTFSVPNSYTVNGTEIMIALTGNETLDELASYLTEKPIEIQCVLATPIETPLSEEELAAYSALHTYKDHTTVSNNAGAWMELEYVMDAKKYIDSLVAAPIPRLAQITLSASAWTGSNSLYSQVVTIPGITEYSKVDLLPSVEQLAIFFNKNVSFVTENEDGVVTVYAIGDKPLLDYTMQVQITEVAV